MAFFRYALASTGGGALAVAVVLLAPWGCASSPDDPKASSGADPGQDADTDADAGPLADAGPDAPADAPDDVHAPTDVPDWVDMPDSVAGCVVQRIANPDQLKLFTWKKCDALEQCADAVWNENIIGSDSEIGRRTKVVDDGTTVHIAVAYHSDVGVEDGVVVTREDGLIELGLRVDDGRGICNLNLPDLGGGRFGAILYRAPDASEPARRGALLAKLGDASSLDGFDIDPAFPAIGEDWTVMGDKRWLWGGGPVEALSNVNATQMLIVPDTSPPDHFVDSPSTSGPIFFAAVTSYAGDEVEAYVGRTDGIGPMERFIEGTPDPWVGSPMFAHSHIAWLQGIGPAGSGKYDAVVGLWASPYAEDPADLVPEKIADMPFDVLFGLTGGWGRYLTTAGEETPTYHHLVVWDLATKTSSTIVLPEDRYLEATPSLTRSALWVVPSLVTSPQRGLMRIDL